MSCPINVKSNTIEHTVHTSRYCILDVLDGSNLIVTLYRQSICFLYTSSKMQKFGKMGLRSFNSVMKLKKNLQ